MVSNCVDGGPQWLGVARHLSLLAPCLAPTSSLSSLAFEWQKTVLIELYPESSASARPAAQSSRPDLRHCVHALDIQAGRSPASRTRARNSPGPGPVTDRLIRITTVLTVVAIAGFAAITSYQHAAS
jgi:hypothetical protein